jgi:MFS transporter, SET family, sugar efflux transporter
MAKAFVLIWQDATLRMAMLGALLFGCFASTIGPYQSLIAIQMFGLSNAGYALVLVCNLIIAVIAAVGIGIITDQRPSRKGMALMASAATICGAALVWLIPFKGSFVLAHTLIFPLSGTVFGQIFAISRLASQTYPMQDRAGILAIIRALFAVPFVLVLPVWGWAADHGMSLLAVYPGILVFGAL